MKTFVFPLLIFLMAVLILLTSGCSNEAERHYNTGVELQEQGRLEEAIVEYNEAISLDPELAEAYSNRGIVYVNKGEYDKATAAFDRAIELDPQVADAYLGRGLAYGSKGEYDKALSDLEKCIELSNNPALVELAQQLLDELR